MRTIAMWRAVIEASAETVPKFENALAKDAVASSCFEISDSANWSIEALFKEPLHIATLEKAIKRRLKLTAKNLGLTVPLLSLKPVPDKDWVIASLGALAPIQAGRLFIHGAHDKGRAPFGAVSLEVEAGRAFGNGRHETTKGCLLALDKLAKTHTFRKPLDLGCGAGLLAMAMARIWRTAVIASDIDPSAIAVTKANIRKNGLHPWVKPVLANGFANPYILGLAPYDLIVANILARPLKRLAPAISKYLAPKGHLVLSGLLTKQDTDICSTYRAQGFRLIHRRCLGSWITLELRK